MANPTTNYSFAMPTNTDLVKDLPADFEIFGQAVDTQMKTNADAAIAKTIVDAKGDIIAATAADTVSRLAVGANNTVLTADSSTATGLKWAASASPALILLNKTTLSSTTNVSLDNVFSATYDNYKIILEGSFASNTEANLRLRVSSSDNSTSNYYYAMSRANISGTASTNNGSGVTSFLLFRGNTSSSSTSIDIYRPFASVKTTLGGTFLDRNGDVGGSNVGFFDLTTSFDGFSVFFTNGCTGTLSVYGYGI